MINLFVQNVCNINIRRRDRHNTRTEIEMIRSIASDGFAAYLIVAVDHDFSEFCHVMMAFSVIETRFPGAQKIIIIGILGTPSFIQIGNLRIFIFQKFHEFFFSGHIRRSGCNMFRQQHWIQIKLIMYEISDAPRIFEDNELPSGILKLSV